MNEFLNFFDEMRKRKKYKLEIYYSSIMDWCITASIGDVDILQVQECDKELAFAKAQVLFKQWLIDNNGGY